MMTSTNDRPSGPPTPTPEAHLKANALGVGAITFLVVAAAAPLTVMAGVAPLAVLIGGIGAPVGYLAAGVVLLLFAIGFMAMTRHTGGAGAFYSYVTIGIGRPAGMAAGLLAVVAYNALQIGVYGLLGQQIHDAIAQFTGLDVPWWLLAFAAMALVWLVGRRGIDVGAKLLGVLLVAETAILALLVLAVIAQGGATGLSAASFAPSAVLNPSIVGVLAFAFAAFMGFESTALYRPEARQPERTIPRATYLSVAFMGLFYCLVVWAFIQAFDPTELITAAQTDPATMFFVAIERFVGVWASDLMYFLIMTSVLASQIAFHNAITRYTFNLARDGLLPAALAHTHPRYGSPDTAGVWQTVLAAVVVGGFALVGADPYQDVLLKVNTPGVVGIIALLALTSAAVVAYFAARRHTVRAPGTLAVATLSTLLLIGVLIVLVLNIDLLTNAGPLTNVLLVGMVPAVFAAGLVGARWLRRNRPDVYAHIGAAHPEDGQQPAPEPTDHDAEVQR